VLGSASTTGVNSVPQNGHVAFCGKYDKLLQAATSGRPHVPVKQAFELHTDRLRLSGAGRGQAERVRLRSAPLRRAFGHADKGDMDAVLLEPISPELVLVCPELRQQAIAVLPDFAWQTFIAQARARAVPQSPERIAGALRVGEVRRAAVEMVKLLPWALTWFVCVTLATLAMTLIADATR
jgi:hypothetical protein